MPNTTICTVQNASSLYCECCRGSKYIYCSAQCAEDIPTRRRNEYKWNWARAKRLPTLYIEERIQGLGFRLECIIFILFSSSIWIPNIPSAFLVPFIFFQFYFLPLLNVKLSMLCLIPLKWKIQGLESSDLGFQVQ